MKITYAVGILAALSCSASAAETLSERTWQQSYTVLDATPRLYVRNIWGSVTVRAGSAGEIVVAAVERRSAPTAQLFEQSKSQLELAVNASRGGLSMVVDHPDQASGRIDVCRGCRLEYQFVITVPAGTFVDVGTVTDGRLEVAGVVGQIRASNVNGPVTVSGMHECGSIESVNGKLDVKFARAPIGACSLKTINGAITIGLPDGAGFDAALSIGHGTIESEFDAEPIELPMLLETRERQDKLNYRVEHPAGLRVGSGGPAFTFASLNGDVRIVKNK